MGATDGGARVKGPKEPIGPNVGALAATLTDPEVSEASALRALLRYLTERLPDESSASALAGKVIEMRGSYVEAVERERSRVDDSAAPRDIARALLRPGKLSMWLVLLGVGTPEAEKCDAVVQRAIRAAAEREAAERIAG